MTFPFFFDFGTREIFVLKISKCNTKLEMFNILTVFIISIRYNELLASS